MHWVLQDNIYVFDTPDGYKIGEVNNLNSAGFYDGDMCKLAIALEELES